MQRTGMVCRKGRKTASAACRSVFGDRQPQGGICNLENRVYSQKLYRTGQVAYDEFFCVPDRSELVATFLAMLELMKSKRIVVSDDNTTVYFRREPPVHEENEGGEVQGF